ncbi:MAG: enoyl-CoA hydratase-related protein [Alphaproteobacteria bacterium]|nr:enoyl-CoA hydratase-related protein [Alphaproteobacteria bacterium]
MTEFVQVGRADGVATVTLNRPDKLNALNKVMWQGVGVAFRELSRDEAVRCVVLTAAGGNAFSPGADIAEFGTERADVAQATAYGGLMHCAMGAIGDCPHPTLAVIHGICVGGGLELAAMCDLRICGASSRFGVPINRIGVVMAYPEMEALIGLVGRAVALEILFEGRVFGADEALQKGLVNRVVADDQVAAEGQAAARRIADGAPLVNRWHKKFARRLGDAVPLSAQEKVEGFAAFGTEDFREGVRAFLAKEKPSFKGR